MTRRCEWKRPLEANTVSVILSNIEPDPCTNGAARVDLHTVDETWEQIQESALRAFHTGRTELASRNWERAMVVARRHFGPADPRLAASLTNHGFVLRLHAERYEAERHLREALAVWERSWRWVGRMAPPGCPDDAYPAAARAWFDSLINQRYAASFGIQVHDKLPEYRLHLWTEHRPAAVCDVRKLMAAVLLIVSRSRL
jgi:hypothetical protein